jgi:hypothetical protein
MISMELISLQTSTMGYLPAWLLAGKNSLFINMWGYKPQRHEFSGTGSMCRRGQRRSLPLVIYKWDATIIYHSSAFAHSDRNGKYCLRCRKLG